MQQLHGEYAVGLHTNGKHAVLRVDVFGARYFEKMMYRLPPFLVLANMIINN